MPQPFAVSVLLF